VLDRMPPSIMFAPADQALVADGACRALMPDLAGLVIATDCSGTPTATQAPLAGESLLLGATPVTLTVTDAHGNAIMHKLQVTVVDQTPPVLTVPTDLPDATCETIPEVGLATAMDSCDATPVVTYLGHVRAEAAGSYTVVRSWKAQDSSGNAVTNQQTITVAIKAPAITTQPQSVTANAGADVTFTVRANSCETMQFQWFFDGAALLGETNTSLTLTNVQAAVAGTYHVTVANAGGATNTEPASLVVNEPAPIVPPILDPMPITPDGQFALQFSGDTNLNYFIEACSSLGGAWEEIGEATEISGQPGVYRFVEPTTPTLPSRLYRVRAERR